MTLIGEAATGTAASATPSRLIVALSGLAATLATGAAAAGLLWIGGGPHIAAETVRGDPAMLDGRGLYRYDTIFAAASQRGTDLVVLVAVVPLLAWSLWRYRHGTACAVLMWAGALLTLAYIYAGPALGTVAYNSLFLVYVALLSVTLSGFVLVFTSVPMRAVETRLAAGMPRRPLAYFLIASGVVVLAVWGSSVVSALLGDTTPARLDTYSNPVTYALDLALICPALLTAGMLVRRGRPMGFRTAVPLLVLEAALAPLLAAQTVVQPRAGISFPPGQLIGPLAGFPVLALVALWFLSLAMRAATTSPGDGGGGRQPN